MPGIQTGIEHLTYVNGHYYTLLTQGILSMNGIVKTVDKAVHMFLASMQYSLLANRTAWVHIGHTRSQWSTRRMVVYMSTRSMQCSYLFPLCTENCLDRHVEEDPNRVALIWEKDEPHQHENITYKYVQV